MSSQHRNPSLVFAVLAMLCATAIANQLLSTVTGSSPLIALGPIAERVVLEGAPVHDAVPPPTYPAVEAEDGAEQQDTGGPSGPPAMASEFYEEVTVETVAGEPTMFSGVPAGPETMAAATLPPSGADGTRSAGQSVAEPRPDSTDRRTRSGREATSSDSTAGRRDSERQSSTGVASTTYPAAVTAAWVADPGTRKGAGASAARQDSPGKPAGSQANRQQAGQPAGIGRPGDPGRTTAPGRQKVHAEAKSGPPARDHHASARSGHADRAKSAGHKSAGRAEAGHKSAGNAKVGHKSAGHKSAGHKSAGHKSAGHKSAGHAKAGTNNHGKRQHGRGHARGGHGKHGGGHGR